MTQKKLYFMHRNLAIMVILTFMMSALILMIAVYDRLKVEEPHTMEPKQMLRLPSSPVMYEDDMIKRELNMLQAAFDDATLKVDEFGGFERVFFYRDEAVMHDIFLPSKAPEWSCVMTHVQANTCIVKCRRQERTPGIYASWGERTKYVT